MSDDIQSKVIDIIAERLGKEADSITETSNIIADLGADSLDIAEVMMDLEDEFGVKLDEDNAEGPATVGDLVKFIQGKVNENG